MAEDPSDPAAEGESGERKQPRQIWIYGINDHVDNVSPEQLRAVSAKGNFRTDFDALCESLKITPHTALGVQRNTEGGGSSGRVLSVSSILLDRVSMQLVKHLIPTSLHLDTVRFTSCKLDIDMLALLRAGISDTCTVQTLQIEWNPLEEMLATKDLKSLSDLSHEALDELERDRDKKDAQRRLRIFRELLLSVFSTEGDDEAIDSALAKLRGGGDAELELSAWNDLLEEKLSMQNTEASELFDVLDGLYFGIGDGKVSLDRLKQQLSQAELPDLTEEEEAQDSIGNAFAAFVNDTSVLENVSLRYCDIGRIEGRQIGEALKKNQHLKSLNLWGNRICDRGVATIAEALEGHYALQYLGLGHNRVTHVGLGLLVKNIGACMVTNEQEAKDLQKSIQQQQAAQAKAQKAPPPPKKDASGRERHQFPLRCDDIEERTGADGTIHWIWFRNLEFKTLNLERNPISGCAEGLKLLEDIKPWGVGHIILRETPAAKAMLAAEDRQKKEAEKAKAAPGNPSAAPEAAEKAKEEEETPAEPARPKGWTFHLK